MRHDSFLPFFFPSFFFFFLFIYLALSDLIDRLVDVAVFAFVSFGEWCLSDSIEGQGFGQMLQGMYKISKSTTTTTTSSSSTFQTRLCECLSFDQSAVSQYLASAFIPHANELLAFGTRCIQSGNPSACISRLHLLTAASSFVRFFFSKE